MIKVNDKQSRYLGVAKHCKCCAADSEHKDISSLIELIGGSGVKGNLFVNKWEALWKEIFKDEVNSSSKDIKNNKKGE